MQTSSGYLYRTYLSSTVKQDISHRVPATFPCTYVRHIYSTVRVTTAGVRDELNPGHIAYGVDEVRIRRTREHIGRKRGMHGPVETVICCNKVGA